MHVKLQGLCCCFLHLNLHCPLININPNSWHYLVTFVSFSSRLYFIVIVVQLVFEACMSRTLHQMHDYLFLCHVFKSSIDPPLHLICIILSESIFFGVLVLLFYTLCSLSVFCLCLVIPRCNYSFSEYFPINCCSSCPTHSQLFPAWPRCLQSVNPPLSNQSLSFLTTFYLEQYVSYVRLSSYFSFFLTNSAFCFS